MTTLSRVFLARAGADGQDEEVALESGLAVIGFTEFPSLAGLTDYASILNLVTTTVPSLKPRAAGNYAGQLWAFAISMKPGDVVVLPRKRTAQVALGKCTGAYEYRDIGGTKRHVRPVQWIRTDVPRSAFQQDLLNSFGAFMTVCNVSRNAAEARVAAVLNGAEDPGVEEPVGNPVATTSPELALSASAEADIDLELAAEDQIAAHIQNRFTRHDLARLVEAVLLADGWQTTLSPPGPDGGVDIFAGRGSLGLDSPRLCVQVKSSLSPADVTVFRTLQGSMQTFRAEQGLLVCWGGFNRAVQGEAKQSYFSIRLWHSGDLVSAILRNYERLSPEIQAELPLKRVWMLVTDDEGT